MRVLWWGTYSRGSGYPRTPVLIEALRASGAEVRECHAPLFEDARSKVALAGGVTARARFAMRLAWAWIRLTFGFFLAGRRDVVVVGYTGHLDVYLARLLSIAWRRPVVLDAFLSPWDTVVNDRKLLSPESAAARILFRVERNALRLADLVLTDTRAHADFMAGTFGVPRDRFVAVPVGSLVSAPERARVPVPATGGGAPPARPRPFTALFVGTFVPLQGLPYILDAAEQAPDLRFWVAGDGPGAEILEEEIEQRLMTNLVFERRFLPRSVLERRYAEADVVLGVFGTTDKAARVVPCKVYDGLAAGKPVVTGDGPGPRELLVDGHDALLVPRGDSAAIVAALRRVRDDKDLAARLAAGGLRLAHERFGAEAIGLRLRAALGRQVHRT